MKVMTMINRTIAETIMLAQKLYEESYDDFGEHTRSQEDCWIEACKTKELPDDLWYVLHLANHWCNSLQGWAECILEGRTFTEEISTPITDDVAVPESCGGLKNCIDCQKDGCPINSPAVQAITDESIPDGGPVGASWLTGGV